MKAKPTLQEAIYIEGLPEWYTQATPADFWTGEAFALFEAARLAGIIAFDSLADSWTAGPNIPKAALAYFCKMACKRLHLNNGAHTNWQPFEAMFNSGFAAPSGPLRLCLHNLQESEGQESKQRNIDTFFNEYTGPNDTPSAGR